MQPQPKALRAPDYAKAFGILLVVFGHVLRGLARAGVMREDGAWASIDRAIYLFHMPLFFYISGLFFAAILRRHGYAGMSKRSALILLLPLAAWSYLQFSLQYVFASDANDKLSLFDVLTAPFPPRQQFWFLGVLFLSMMGAGALLRWRRGGTAALTLAMLACFALRVFAGGWIDQVFGVNRLSFLGDQFVLHFPFFVLGVVAGSAFLERLKVGPLPCLALLALLLWGEQQPLPAAPFFSAAAAILCVLTVYRIALTFERPADAAGEPLLSRVVAFVGMNSMIIYLAHVICAAAMRAALTHAGIHNVAIQLGGGVLAGVGLPLLLVPAGLGLARHYPRLAAALLPVRARREGARPAL